MTTHTLKAWPEFYDAIESGVKTWEFRRDDRGFRVGDVLVLERRLPSDLGDRDAKTLRVRVTYIFYGTGLGVPEGFCIMSIVKEAG